MGIGYEYKCRKCGEEYHVFPGAGMMYPNVSKELIEDIAKGVYGKERKERLKKTPNAAVNAETFVYLCSNCHHWEEGKDATLYAPNDDREAEEPNVMDQDLKEGYHVIQRYYKSCPRCGRRMHKASDEELKKLPCPKCGTKNEPASWLHWD